MAGKYTKIQTLDGLTGVRAKLGMYLGATTSNEGQTPKALTQMFQETLSNSIDEHTAGHANHIQITIHPDNSLTIQDDGRGIPRGNNWDVVTRAFTKTHSSGKFDQTAYANAGTTGTHGIGMKAVNAASQYLKIEATTRLYKNENPQKDTYEKYVIVFNQETITQQHVEEIRATKTGETPTLGSRVTFKPDTGPISNTNPKPVLENDHWDLTVIRDRCKTAAMLAPGLSIHLVTPEHPATTDGEGGETFCYPEGLQTILETPFFNTKTTLTHEKHVYGLTFHASMTSGVWRSFANGIETPNGSHNNGLAYELKKQFDNLYNLNCTNTDIQETLSVAFHLQIPGALLEFEGQTKETLATSQARTVMREFIAGPFVDWLHDNPQVMKKLGECLTETIRIREVASRARTVAKNTGKLAGRQQLELASKIKLATSRTPSEKEMYVTEGDSASNIGRDPKTQTIIPLRGKILNVFKLGAKQTAKAMENSEVKAIVQVLGAGAGNKFNIDAVQYHKFIIAADADDDGMHIQTLIIGLCYTLFPGLIEAGMLYVVETPLFKAVSYSKGEPVVYPFYSRVELDRALPKLGKVDIRRYKGLGEMNPGEAHNAIANPATRRLRRITVDDVSVAFGVLDVLIGNDSKGRKDWVDGLDFSGDPVN